MSPDSRLEYGDRTVKTRAPTTWNDLPEELKTSKVKQQIMSKFVLIDETVGLNSIIRLFLGHCLIECWEIVSGDNSGTLTGRET